MLYFETNIHLRKLNYITCSHMVLHCQIFSHSIYSWSIVFVVWRWKYNLSTCHGSLSCRVINVLTILNRSGTVERPMKRIGKRSHHINNCSENNLTIYKVVSEARTKTELNFTIDRPWPFLTYWFLAVHDPPWLIFIAIND